MEAYTDFAAVYDTFMDETPYEVWGTFVAGLIEKYGISKPVRSGAGLLRVVAPKENFSIIQTALPDCSNQFIENYF